jgi:hypothetical protein
MLLPFKQYYTAEIARPVICISIKLSFDVCHEHSGQYARVPDL